MDRRRVTLFAGGCALVIGACSATTQSAVDEIASSPTGSDTISSPITGSQVTNAVTESDPATTSSSTDPATPISTVITTVSTTTTDLNVEPEIFDPVCVAQIEPLDSLGSIAARYDDETMNVVALRTENDLPNADLTVGEYIDVCVGNGLNDITGEQRTGPNEEIVAFAVKQNVEVQQLKLNKLFADLGPPDLLVDGVSGPVTRQRLCAARLALGLPTTTEDMAAGSEEEDTLFAAETLPTPFTSSIQSDRWILIDRTCQIMFVGEREELTFIFPTSTGSEGHETRNQDRSRAFRFDPALENNGWHDSTDFPVGADNPLNGNMYRPLYFDLGQAIHGANNVPTSPQSKGCARLRVAHQDALVTWMGLDDASGPLWSPNQIRVTVNVQGEYIAR